MSNLIHKKNNLNNEDGQSFVEFVLLMAMVAGISFSFMKIVNTGVAENWKKAIEIIVDDPNVEIKFRGD